MFSRDIASSASRGSLSEEFKELSLEIPYQTDLSLSATEDPPHLLEHLTSLEAPGEQQTFYYKPKKTEQDSVDALVTANQEETEILLEKGQELLLCHYKSEEPINPDLLEGQEPLVFATLKQKTLYRELQKKLQKQHKSITGYTTTWFRFSESLSQNQIQKHLFNLANQHLPEGGACVFLPRPLLMKWIEPTTYTSRATLELFEQKQLLYRALCRLSPLITLSPTLEITHFSPTAVTQAFSLFCRRWIACQEQRDFNHYLELIPTQETRFHEQLQRPKTKEELLSCLEQVFAEAEEKEPCFIELSIKLEVSSWNESDLEQIASHFAKHTTKNPYFITQGVDKYFYLYFLL